MAQPILVPQVGQDLSEATVVELNVKVGDQIKKGDVVAVVESEKASFEVEAFVAGTVIRLNYAQGDIAEVLSALMDIGEAGEVIADAAPSSAPTASPEPDTTAPAGAAASVAAPVDGASHRSSPLARRVAGERGINIRDLAGSGPGGAVVLRDVAAAQAGTPDATGPLELRSLQAGQGMPIVFLHGFGSDLSSWRPLIGGIASHAPMLAIDLPGHGASMAHPADSFDDIVDLVGRSLRHIETGVHIVGHSLGAAVAVALTGRGDLDIRSLTLLAPAGLGASVDGTFVDGFLNAESEAALARWMERLVHDPAHLTPTLVRATRAARKDSQLTTTQRKLARVVFEGSTQLFSVRADLAAFGGVASVVLGRDDAILSPHEVEAQVPGHVALYRLAGIGHLPHVEASQLVQRIIGRTVSAAE